MAAVELPAEVEAALALAVTQALEVEDVVTLASLRREREERETMFEAASGLYTLGYPLSWRGFFLDGGRVASLPTYPFQHAPDEVGEIGPAGPSNARRSGSA